MYIRAPDTDMPTPIPTLILIWASLLNPPFLILSVVAFAHREVSTALGLIRAEEDDLGLVVRRWR
jgi:hypothetical protein